MARNRSAIELHLNLQLAQLTVKNMLAAGRRGLSRTDCLLYVEETL